MLEAANAIAHWSQTFRQDNEAVVLMGHGTPHQANVYYPALQQYLQRTNANLYLGTLDGFPSFNDVDEKLLLANVKKAWLVPFLTVAGDHATKDMTGSGDDTWEKQLQRKGIETTAIMSGLGQLDSMVAIWVRHLRLAVETLQ
jgi:sirohydrochlorin cobaltochelatase